ncbi:hypothetical protein AAVH_10132 [Aphelenchoides avenae]|nr:hypothetical protein AAVH_10132 [Aphelenchus avenae]
MFQPDSVPREPKSPSSSASSVKLPGTIRSHDETAKLREKLRCGAEYLRNANAADKLGLAWFSSAYQVRTANQIHMVSNLLSPLRSRRKVRRTLLVDDTFIDVFVCLGRSTLDAVHLTCIGFRAIIETRLTNFCFRELAVDIYNQKYAPRITRGPPDSAKKEDYTAPDVYVLKMRAERNDKRTFVFKSHSLQEMLAKFEEKMPEPTFVRFLDLQGTADVVPQIVESHPALAARTTIGTAWIECPTENLATMDALLLLGKFSAFRAINDIQVTNVARLNVNDEFFRRCREMGVLSHTLHASDEVDISADGLLDFCFGPTREGRDSVDRRVEDLPFFHHDLPRRVLESVKRSGKPRHSIQLEAALGACSHKDFPLLEAEVKKYYELQENYALGGGHYATRFPEEGVEVEWVIDTEVDYIRCTVQLL